MAFAGDSLAGAMALFATCACRNLHSASRWDALRTGRGCDLSGAAQGLLALRRLPSRTGNLADPSGLLQLNFRVYRLEFGTRVVDLHLPIDAPLA